MRSGLVFSRVPTINVYIHEGCQPWRKYTFIVLHSSLPPPYTPPYTFHLTHSSLPPPMNWLEGNVTTLYKKRHCNTLQHTVRESTHNVATLYKKRHCNTLQHTATHCNTLQHTVRESTHNVTTLYKKRHCNILQHTVRESTHNVTTLYKKRPPFKKQPARGLSHMREVHSFVATYT